MDSLDLTHVQYYNVGEMNLECHYCQALGFVDENKGTNRTPHFGISCCNQNKCVMPALQDIPDELKEYFTSDTPKAKQFRKYCRRFNSGLSFCSLQVKDATVGRGPAAFTASGQLYRRIGSVLQQETSSEPCCMQTYFYDNEGGTFNQDTHRATRGSNRQDGEELTALKQLDEQIFRELRQMLENNNNSCCNRSSQ